MYEFDIAVLTWANSWVFWWAWADPLIIFRVEWLPWWTVAGLLVLGFVALPPLSTVFPSFRALRRKNWQMIFTALAAGLVVRFGVVELIRALYNRLRPFEVLPDLHALVSHEAGGSFPSGHAAFFFAIAVVVGRYYPKTSIIFYAAAFSLSFSRVAVGIHWPSDVIGGAVIGVAVGLLANSIARKFPLPQKE